MEQLLKPIELDEADLDAIAGGANDLNIGTVNSSANASNALNIFGNIGSPITANQTAVAQQQTIIAQVNAVNASDFLKTFIF